MKNNKSGVSIVSLDQDQESKYEKKNSFIKIFSNIMNKNKRTSSTR